MLQRGCGAGKIGEREFRALLLVLLRTSVHPLSFFLTFYLFVFSAPEIVCGEWFRKAIRAYVRIERDWRYSDSCGPDTRDESVWQRGFRTHRWLLLPIYLHFEITSWIDTGHREQRELLHESHPVLSGLALLGE